LASVSERAWGSGSAFAVPVRSATHHHPRLRHKH
jgi:hypothetical protein